MEKAKISGKILEQFIEGCRQHKLDIDINFARYSIQLLARDAADGLNIYQLNACNIQRFLDNLLKKYANPLDATMCNMRVCYFYKNSHDLLKIDVVKEKYDLEFQTKLKVLIDDILQYPETSNEKQIEALLGKMQVFIIARYNLGCPKNHVLLKQTRLVLKNVLGREDLKNYVLRQKHHRLEYLQRLSAVVCGNLIYTNLSPEGDNENMRDIRADLIMAQKNTNKAFESLLRKVIEIKDLGINSIKNVIEINVKQEKVLCHSSMEDVREVNKFVALYFRYENFLKELNETVEKTWYIISVDLEKLKCVLNKIDDSLKYRTAINLEVIIPHFVYLSELWQRLDLYLNQFVEINKIRDILESYVTTAIEERFVRNVNKVKDKTSQTKNPIERSFKTLTEQINKLQPIDSDFLKIKNYTSDFCTLTIAITNGLLVSADLQRKLCSNLKRKFGFRNSELAKYAELHVEDYLKTFKDKVFTSVDLILLFNLDEEICAADDENARILNETRKNTELGTQTEMVFVGDLSVPNRINITWNKWDFHRETIRLANLIRCQTHSTQTYHSFAQRNAQNQAYNTRRHV